MKRPILILLITAFSMVSYAQIETTGGDTQIYHFDNTPDCVSEGFIRFSNRTTGKVGLMNASGDIVIPAEYSSLSRVQNGLIYALKGATKIVSDDGEHHDWEGGQVLLIDINNQILIMDFTYEYALNFYSLSISNRPDPDSLRHSFKAVDGQYYSFIDFKKEFKVWLISDLLPDLSRENLLRIAHPKITYWNDGEGWVSENQIGFIDRNYERMLAELMGVKNQTSRFNLFLGGLNPLIYESDDFKKYYNDCGEAQDWRYPVQSVVITRQSEGEMQQDHFDFLRTDEGYKLISVVLRP